jgi:trehalose synthase
MPARVREVPFQRTTNLNLFRDLDHLDEEIDELVRLGRQVSARLETGRVWMLNSTDRGGGVAEMMPRVCSLLADVGVHTRWIVLEPDDPGFFPLTKRLHNALHGESPGVGLGEGRTLYERVSAEAAENLHHVRADDVLVVHDPQPAGVGAYVCAEHRPKLVWRCHIGIPEQNEHTRAGWDFLERYLGSYERLLFSSSAYVPHEWADRSGEVHPGIDPLSHKNRTLRPYKLVGVLDAAGLVDGPPVPAWARFHAPVQRYVDGAWEATPIPKLLYRPFVLEISRFDRLKGFQHLIPAFVDLVRGCGERALHVHADATRVQSELDRLLLVLAGPDPAGVSDDPEAAEVLDELCAQHAALPVELRERVHLLRLPMVDRKENALIVNALQRQAAVVVQNSIREGFGLTVAEALWKATPLVASNVGGISVQVRNGTDGLLVDDPRDHVEISRALLRMIASPLEAESMARSGHRRVREHFLMLSQVRAWLGEIGRLLDGRKA